MPHGEIGAQRLGDRGLVAVQILARDRAADAFEIGGDLAPDIAAVEIVEAGMGELLERRGERLLLQRGADRRRLAVDQKGRGKARHVLELGQMVFA